MRDTRRRTPGRPGPTAARTRPPRGRPPGARPSPGRAAGAGPAGGPAARDGGRLPLLLGAAVVLAQVAYPLTPSGGARDGLTVATVVLFALASLVHAAVSRGPRAAAGLLVVAGGGGLLAEAVGVSADVPFGTYAYQDTLGPGLLGVPVVIPLAWTMMAWPAYLVGARLTRTRARAARVAVAAGALASWDLFLDPQMVDAGHWSWADPSPGLPGVPTVPLTNFAGWVLVALVLMTVLDRVVPVRPDPADAVPYALYLWTYFSSVLAHLAFFGLPASAAWGGVGMGLVAVPLVVSLRRHGLRPASPASPGSPGNPGSPG